MNKNILRIAALMLSMLCAASVLSSCGIFVESFLSEYTGAQTKERYDHPISRYPDDETAAPPETTDDNIYVTVIAPETTASPETAASVPEKTVIPETTAAPETTESEVPSEFADHIYLIAKNNGNCKELVGKVNVHVFLINDTVSGWDYNAQGDLKTSLAEQEKLLEADAAGYGKSLDLTFNYTVVEISVLVDTSDTEDDWQEAALAALGLKNVASAQESLASQYGGDSNPIIFAVNKAGRAYANWSSGKKSERVTLFSSSNDSFRHELCHLYGARDFYYPDEAKALANRHIPDSIMNSGEKVDALTAFLIGWDDELDANAYAFLDATKHYTQEYLDAEQSKQNVTGNVTDHQLSYGIYTGYLERGVPNGFGKLIYSEGDTYEGNFDHGKLHGTGKYTWTSGSSYEGDWLNGERTGKGTYIWSAGDKYIGDFVDGVRTGWGKYIWSDGDWYEGEFIEGVRTGQGTMHYSSGSVYSGEWLEGYRHGQGTYTYAAGHVYVGAWENGDRKGYGSMIWSDGSSYEGEWLDNKRHGYGKYVNKSGTVFEGQWLNDVFQG